MSLFFEKAPLKVRALLLFAQTPLLFQFTMIQIKLLLAYFALSGT
jgi:hypothetical protein